MSKFYCNKCEKEVTLKNGFCPLCKTNWDEVIEESVENGYPVGSDMKPKNLDDSKRKKDSGKNSIIEFLLSFLFSFGYVLFFISFMFRSPVDNGSDITEIIYFFFMFLLFPVFIFCLVIAIGTASNLFSENKDKHK